MNPIMRYKVWMIESKIQWDALLLTGVKDFSTANGNVGGNEAATSIATQPATRRQRADNIRNKT
jgi:hypothetical protein